MLGDQKSLPAIAATGPYWTQFRIGDRSLLVWVRYPADRGNIMRSTMLKLQTNADRRYIQQLIQACPDILERAKWDQYGRGCIEIWRTV